MAAVRRIERLHMRETRRAARLLTGLFWLSAAATAVLGRAQLSSAQTATDFHRTLTVTSAEMVTLDVDVAEGEVDVSYGRDGEVSIAAVATSRGNAVIGENFFLTTLGIEQSGNVVKIRARNGVSEERIKVVYRIEVPYRTKLTSRVDAGKQAIRGILGPVEALTNQGDIKAAYVSDGLEARVGTGNLDLQVIGGHVDAVAGSGNISGSRLPQGIRAETGEGDITLVVVGPSTAIVKKGTGRIDVGGARDSFAGSTDRGDLHVKAIPHEDWQLRSASGDVRVELPPASHFEIEASTTAGKLQLDRDDMSKPDANALQFREAINGGGKRIAIHTESGRIMIR